MGTERRQVQMLLIVLLGYLATTSTTPVDVQHIVPPQFDQICKSEDPIPESQLIRVNCQVSRGDSQQFSWRSLRNWLLNPANNVSHLMFSYSIACETGSNVSVTWPMKSPGVTELSIVNCAVVDVFGDFGNPVLSNISAHLVKLKLINCRMVIKVSTMLRMATNLHQITEDYDCLHDNTMQEVVFRNISYNIVDDMGFLNSNSSGTLSNLPKVIREDMNRIECHYKELRLLDESVSDTLSFYHHRFLTKYSQFPKLEFLNYSYNSIDVVPEELKDWSFYFSAIKYIDLSHNDIFEIDFKSTFTGSLTNDTIIDLQYNNITTITNENIARLRRLNKTFIDIRNNPIICDCDLKEFVEAMRNRSLFTGNLKKYEYIKHMRCAAPPKFEGKTLDSLTVEILACDPITDQWVIPFVVLAVLALLLLTLIILAFLYRREIRILCFTRINIRFPGDEYVGLGPKKYHAFVSYSNQDEDWVLDVLSKKLEDPASRRYPSPGSSSSDENDKRRKRALEQKFKLCLHCRDFVVGMTIIENIINSVEQSKHTIIVLTQHFMQSKWAMEEFVQAYHQSILEKRRHLIFVLLEELPDDKMDPLLKRCLKTFTYLKAWDRLFYDRLLYSLATDNKLTRDEISKEKEDMISCNSHVASEELSREVDSGDVTYSRSSSSDQSVLTVSETLSSEFPDQDYSTPENFFIKL